MPVPAFILALFGLGGGGGAVTTGGAVVLGGVRGAQI